MPSPLDPHAVAAILRWHVDAGVDWAVDDQAHDRFAESALAASRRSIAAGDEPRRRELPRLVGDAEPNPGTAIPRPAVAPQRAAPVAPNEAAESARTLAASARTLAELRDLVDGFNGCALKATATRLAFSDGNPEGGLMLVGEAPGADEDRQGKPFVGKAGRLLDKMLAAIGLDRSQAYIANIVPWRPPGNRTPTPQETAICLPFIQRQIELAAPRILVTLGGPSTQTLLGVKDGILRTRGRWSSCVIAERQIPTMPTLHPAYLLRQPAQKRLAWRDLQAIRKAFDAP
ncbi:DNA polymerase [Rhizobiales bacterium GAS191]|nr:DNA polymerase [Rhizobiales bacterium GAS191]SED25744.1 DNA polymerase [Rhizobiales bacterium GAS188]